MKMSEVMIDIISWALPSAAILEYVLIFLISEKEKSLKKEHRQDG